MTIISSCCGVKAIEETDLCSKCKEHTLFYDDSCVFIAELIKGKQYRAKHDFGMGEEGSYSISIPKGTLWIYQGEDTHWYKFRNELGIRIEVWKEEYSLTISFLEEI